MVFVEGGSGYGENTAKVGELGTTTTAPRKSGNLKVLFNVSTYYIHRSRLRGAGLEDPRAQEQISAWTQAIVAARVEGHEIDVTAGPASWPKPVQEHVLKAQLKAKKMRATEQGLKDHRDGCFNCFRCFKAMA